MEPKFNTSFIPKKSMQSPSGGTAVKTYVARRTTRGPFFYMAFLLFFISLLASVGLFAYTKLVASNIDDKIAQIEKVQAAFEPGIMKELIRTNRRMQFAQEILDKHRTPTEFLRLLEQMTLRTVQYDALSITMPEGATANAQTGANTGRPVVQAPTVTLNGGSSNFTQVALQADEFAKSADIRVPVIGNLGKDATGRAIFSATMELDPRLISYTDALRSGRRTGSLATPTPAPTPAPQSTSTATTTGTSTAETE